MATGLANRVCRGVAFLLRLDMATGIVIATALFIWLAWH